jgi:drug/metabolite transporter superfamily protein YnfA
MKFILKLLISTAISYVIGRWAIAQAYASRGYKAYGGEYILIMLTFLGCYYAMTKLFNRLGGDRRDDKGCHRDAT